MATQEQTGIYRQFHTLFSVGTVREQTDGQLLKSFVAGRGEIAELAFSALVERHGPMVFRTCRGILRDDHHAEDAFQATFLVLARKSGSLWVRSSLGPWLQQVAYRAASCARAAVLTRQAHERTAAELAASLQASEADRENWEAVLHEEIVGLPERYRGPLILCDLEGCTHEQAAVHLACPVGTVKSRLARGRDRLRERLIRRGHPPTLGLCAARPAPGVVPPPLAESTILTTLRLAMPRAGSGPPGISIEPLVREVSRTMALGKWKMLPVPLLAIATAACAGLLAYGAGAVDSKPPVAQEAPAAKADPQARVERADRPAGERLSATGTVLNPDGSPASGAIVEAAVMQDEPPTLVHADRAGQFKLDGLFGTGGLLFAHTQDGNLQTTRMIPGDAARAAFATPLELRLAPAATHRVIVALEGRPVNGAEVVGMGHSFKVRGMTGKDGKVTLQCPDGEVITRLVAWHPELGVGGMEDLGDGPHRLIHKIALLPARPHKIRVVDLRGQGVAGLTLGMHVRTEDSDWIASGEVERARVVTEAEGVATVAWAPRQKLKYTEVVLIGSDWKIDETDVSRLDEGLTTVHVRRELAVEGRLIMPPGASAAGILISGFGFGPGQIGDTPFTRARRDGTFTIRIPSGHGYLLGVADRDWACDPWSGLILANDTAKPAEIAMKIYAATPITVRVTRGPGREPVADAWIDASNRGTVKWINDKGKEQSGNAGVSSWWKTDAKGVARGGLGKGQQEVTLSSGDWREEREFTVKSNEPVQIEFHRDWLGKRQITGRLTLDGAPYQPSPKFITYAWAPQFPLLPLEFEPTVHPDGTFEVAFDAPNLSLFFSDPEKHRAGFARIGKEVSTLRVILEATATYSGTLLDESAQPMAGQTVQLFVRTSIHEAVPAQRTDSAGHFRFTDVPANVPLQLEIKPDPKKGLEYYIAQGDRLFNPEETRENDRVTSKRANKSEEVGQPAIPLAERLSSLVRDARLSGMHVLIVLQGDASPTVVGMADRLLDDRQSPAILRYLPERVEALRLKTEAAFLKGRGWPAPEPGEVVLVLLGTDGKALGTGQFRAADAARLDTDLAAREFLKRNAPPAPDALAMLKAARLEAEKTGRRVWIIAGGPRCGPCFRLARWIDDHHTILEKDFVIVKVMSGPDDRTRAALAALTRKEQSDPWHAFTEPDGKVLATSEGPLGNIGFPSGVEGLRHFRQMLDRSARRLTPDELGGLINSLSQNP